MSRPRSLASVVRPVTRRAIGKQAAAIGQLMADWPALFAGGPAQHAWPEALSFPRGKGAGGTLTLRVDPADAVVVQHDSDRIINRVNQHLGQQAVVRLKFVQRLPRGVRATAEKAGPPPDITKIDDLLTRVENSELRERLRKIGIALWTRDPDS